MNTATASTSTSASWPTPSTTASTADAATASAGAAPVTTPGQARPIDIIGKPAAHAVGNDRLADETTPLIHDCWYVAGTSADFTRTLVERTLLGRSVVFYRREDGRPVALQNRCAHRSFPLANGRLEGDILRCGYHGIAFRSDGSCADIPTQQNIPRSVCVPAYPVAERGPLVWIWMGDPLLADESAIPDTSWLTSPDWKYASSYLTFAGSYVSLHENLLDLSHFTWLHPTTLGTPEYARTPFEADVSDSRVHIRRFVPDCNVPPIYVRTGIKGRMSRDTNSEFVSPAIHHASAVMSDLSVPEAEDERDGRRRDFTIFITHYLTPETNEQTHYWFTFARDFALDDPEVTEYMGKSALVAFNEDKFALEEIQRMHKLEPEAAAQELHIRSDQAGVATRRILKRLAEEEQTRNQNGKTHGK